LNTIYAGGGGGTSELGGGGGGGALPGAGGVYSDAPPAPAPG